MTMKGRQGLGMQVQRAPGITQQLLALGGELVLARTAHQHLMDYAFF